MITRRSIMNIESEWTPIQNFGAAWSLTGGQSLANQAGGDVPHSVFSFHCYLDAPHQLCLTRASMIFNSGRIASIPYQTRPCQTCGDAATHVLIVPGHYGRVCAETAAHLATAVRQCASRGRRADQYARDPGLVAQTETQATIMGLTDQS